jgi:plastocyanin
MATLAVVAMACGGGGGEQASQESSPAMSAQPEAAAAPTMGGTGAVHEVRMLMTQDGRYVYEPATLTIKVGDTVRWLNVSGFPHNVAFYANQIPAGAEAMLTAAFAKDAGKLGPLSGRLMLQPNETYEISFAGAPAGAYGYFCTPHEALGMKATLTVQP